MSTAPGAREPLASTGAGPATTGQQPHKAILEVAAPAEALQLGPHKFGQRTLPALLEACEEAREVPTHEHRCVAVRLRRPGADLLDRWRIYPVLPALRPARAGLCDRRGVRVAGYYVPGAAPPGYEAVGYCGISM